MAEIIYYRPAILDLIPPDRHTLIEASAGTGKTFAIEHMVLRLLLEGGCTLEQIVAVTFTERATAELRDRIRELIETVVRGRHQRSPLGKDTPVVIGAAAEQKLYAALSSFDRAAIFTIHAFCQKVLTELAFQSGTRFGLEVIDGRRAFHLAFRARLRERLLVNQATQEMILEWLARQTKSDKFFQLEKLFLDAYHQRYQSTGEANAGEKPSLEARMVESCLPDICEQLAHSKLREGQLDYDDMLRWTDTALTGAHGDALVEELRQRFRYGIVDEFQDTDDLQWRIFKRIFVAGGNPVPQRLFVVGDPKQAIYAFRGADVYAYREAQKELCALGGEAVPLVDNFRSTESLIAACNHILDKQCAAPLFSDGNSYANPVRCGIRRTATGADERPIVPVTLMRLQPPAGHKADRKSASEANARYIARTIKQILTPAGAVLVSDSEKSRPVKASDIFVLTRSHSESGEIGEHLKAAGVPFAFYKREGLFQTDQAREILDVLRAIAAPQDRSARLRAWFSPFFAIDYPTVTTIGDVPSTHPLNERLYDWKMLAEKEQFAELFDRLLHETGLLNRELFFSATERELTDYLHIFEVLLEQAVSRRMSLVELIEMLEGLIAKIEEPPGADGNIQRLESERAAVQVTTMHLSKGLEADIVFVFGGMYKGPSNSELAVYHVDGKRCFALGNEGKNAVKGQLQKEESEEDQRLLYVAMTRARAALYLPVFPDGTLKRPVNGCYSRLNLRLDEIVGELKKLKNLSTLFRIDDISLEPSEKLAPLRAAPRDWIPPQLLLREQPDIARELQPLRYRSAPFVMESFTSLTRAGKAGWNLVPADFKSDLSDENPDSQDLAGGSDVGIFLHETIERLNFETLKESPDFDSWRKREDIRRLLADGMRRHRIREPKWFERAPQVIFNALTSPLLLPEGRTLRPLYQLRNVREMEFIYPIPDPSHVSSTLQSGRRLKVERGFFKGFVDFMFEDGGRFYFADWKSDQLPSYGAQDLARHVVTHHYNLQAGIYLLGVLRLLRVTTESAYDQRFGGLLYIFLRGVKGGPNTQGIHFQRPGWNEVCAQERILATVRPLQSSKEPWQ